MIGTSVLNVPAVSSWRLCGFSKPTKGLPSSILQLPLAWFWFISSHLSSMLHCCLLLPWLCCAHIWQPLKVLLAADAAPACSLPGKGPRGSAVNALIPISSISSCHLLHSSCKAACPLVCLLPEDLRRHCRVFPAVGDTRGQTGDVINTVWPGELRAGLEIKPVTFF